MTHPEAATPAPPRTLHAHWRYKGCCVEIAVTHEPGQPGSSALIVLDDSHGDGRQTLEYVLDAEQLDEAARVSREIAQSVIDAHAPAPPGDTMPT